MGRILPALNLDPANSRGVFDPRLSVTRTTTKWLLGQNGLLQSVPAGQLGVEFDALGNCLGASIEEQRINEALYSRDMTNVAWTASNITAAKDQTGIDGTATAASSLLATAGAGTVLQAITSTSSTRAYSAWVKRIVGTGAVSMTVDGGSTWTDVTAQITGVGPNGYSRCVITQAAVTNPSIGFKLTTNADKIAVDFNQEEKGAFATSSIPTTTVAVTRNADAVFMRLADIPGWNANAGTMLVVADTLAIGATQCLASINDGGAVNIVNAYISLVGSPSMTSSNGSTSPSTAIAANTAFKFATAFSANGYSACLNGGSVSSVGAGAMPAGLAKINIGARAIGDQLFSGHIRQIQLFPQALSAADLQTLTS